MSPSVSSNCRRTWNYPNGQVVIPSSVLPQALLMSLVVLGGMGLLGVRTTWSLPKPQLLALVHCQCLRARGSRQVKHTVFPWSPAVGQQLSISLILTVQHEIYPSGLSLAWAESRKRLLPPPPHRPAVLGSSKHQELVPAQGGGWDEDRKGNGRRTPVKSFSMEESAFCSRNKYLTQSPYKGKVNFDSVYQVPVSDGGFGWRDIDTCVSLKDAS